MTFAQTVLKDKACSHCQKPFAPVRPMQAVCSPICAIRKVKADKAKERDEFKRRKENAMSLGELTELAQRAFNAYIRARDEGKPCICCGKPMEPDTWAISVNAGHWRSRGAAPHLRFDEANVHSQRVSCNRPGGAKAGPFREGMIARVGLAEVERLEADNHIHKWERDELIAIRATYKTKLKQLKENE